MCFGTVAEGKGVLVVLYLMCKVEVFGSVRTGMLLPTRFALGSLLIHISDIDIVIMGRWTSLPLRTLAKKLEEEGIPKSMKLIESARVTNKCLRLSFRYPLLSCVTQRAMSMWT